MKIASASVLGDDQIELSKALRVRDQVDGGDRVSGRGHPQDDPRLTAWHPDRRRHAGQDGASGAAGASKEGGDLVGPLGLRCGAQRDGLLVGAQDDVRVEDGEQRVEVASVGGSEEGVDERRVTEAIHLLGRVLLPHARARPARELAGRRHAAVDDRGDVVERNREHVVEDERDALGR